MFCGHRLLSKTGFLLLSLLFLLVPAEASPDDAFPDVVARVRKAVVAVGTAYPSRQPIGDRPPYEVRGSGFAVGDGLHIVTNNHVLPDSIDSDNRESLAVFSGRGRAAELRPARLLASDVEHDLALLRIEGRPLPALRLQEGDVVREGEPVALTGYPIGAVLGFFPATHRGIVAALTPMARAADRGRQLSAVQMARLRNPFEVLQLDIVAYPGNSGSPLYRVATGEVIGVVNSVVVKASRESALSSPSGISYAIPARYIRDLLVSAAGSSQEP